MQWRNLPLADFAAFFLKNQTFGSFSLEWELKRPLEKTLFSFFRRPSNACCELNFDLCKIGKSTEVSSPYFLAWKNGISGRENLIFSTKKNYSRGFDQINIITSPKKNLFTLEKSWKNWFYSSSKSPKTLWLTESSENNLAYLDLARLQ